MNAHVLALAVLGLSSCINRTDPLVYPGSLDSANDAEHRQTVHIEPGTYLVTVHADVPVRLDVADEDADENNRLCSAISPAEANVAASCTLTVQQATGLEITVHSTRCGHYDLTVTAVSDPTPPVASGSYDLVGDCSDG